MENTDVGVGVDEGSGLVRPEEILGFLPEADIEKMLEESASYSIELPEDPTSPEFGMRYLQKVLAQCRQYLNRVQYYLQITRRYEKNLRARIKLEEMNLELRTHQLLADNVIVRQGPSVDDRKALAAAMMSTEHKSLALLRVAHINVDESIKIIKMKYDDLNRSSMDVKTQRQMVKDELDDLGSGGSGYNRPIRDKDGTVPAGLPPAVQPGVRIDPKDLLDDSRRPDDLPPAKDAVHAQQIVNFFSRPSMAPVKAPARPEPAPVVEPIIVPAALTQTISYDDLLTD